MSSLTHKISAQIEVRIIEFNAIVKMFRSKKFRSLQEQNYDAYHGRFAVYEERKFNLETEIDALIEAAGGKAEIWRGSLEK